MISKNWRSVAFAAVFFGASLQPVLAQQELNAIFGLAGELIRQNAQNTQRKQQQAQQNQQQQAARNAQRAQQQKSEFAFFTRTQNALKTLGFYTLSVDGVTGPGTRAAIAAYQSAFQLEGTFQERELFDLERSATEGWRSLNEIHAANAGGFVNRQNFVTASAAGFSSASVYESARASGFSDAETYAAFARSGAPDKTTFEANREQLAAADAAVEQCVNATQERDWVGALVPCYSAAKAKTADAGAQLALEIVLKQSQIELSDNKALLAEKREALAELLNGDAGTDSAQAITTLRGEVNDLAGVVVFTELHLKAGQCGDLVGRGNWEQALPACHTDVSVGRLSGEKRAQANDLLAGIVKNRTLAEAGVNATKDREVAEAKRLALADGQAKAATLIADVSAFAAQGNQFQQGLNVARELVSLRAAADGDDAVVIERHITALEALLGADDAYVSARSAMASAREQAGQTAVLEARRQAEMLDAFVLDYVSNNVTSSHVPALLPLNETLSAALNEGNAGRIISAQAATRKTLESMGLVADLASFAANYKVQQVSAEELEMADAQSANANLALDSAISSSQVLIGSIDSFVDAGGQFADPIGVARGLARLKTELALPGLPDLQVLHDALTRLLDGDANYVAASAQRSVTNVAALANAIALAREDLTAINAFLLTYISANLTQDDILDSVDLQIAVEDALAGPDSAELVRLLEGANNKLFAMDLSDNLVAFTKQQTAKAVVAEAPVANNGLAVTLANSALLEGDNADLLVLRNAAAPHLVFDLVGNLRVEGGVATTCWLHPAPNNPIALLMARQLLAEQGINRLDVTLCETATAEIDLVILQRGDFLALPTSEAQPVVAAFEDGRLKPMALVTGVDAGRESNRMMSEAAEIATRIGNETLQGFGMVQLTRGQGGICPVVTDMAAHGNSLAKRADTLAFLFAEPKFKVPTSPDRTFVAAQRGQCSGIYAASADLRVLSEALERADIGFTTVPIWIEATEVDDEINRLAAISAQQVARETAQEAARQQATQATAALDAAKQADQRSALAQRQAALRIEYEERATGAQKDVADMIRALVQTGNSTDLAKMFPRTHRSIRNAVADKWVITDTQDNLADYGTATWQGRDVEAILVRITTLRENSILGLYHSDCVVLGYLLDREFRNRRDPIEASCTDEATIAEWAAGREFDSVWNLSAN